ncbi:MAG: FtsW/RodA/SpoVE family cell cycle protein [Dysgonamonadaceae bacterium]|jgi:cell division protein FtsW|nr:FtsW/RodA/SpoVE family cell cycle protein [Dysgonamonadaceae bacterium]
MDFLSKIFRGDRVVWMIFTFLCAISIIEVYSASSTLTFKTDYWRPIMRHVTFLLCGLFIVLIVHSCRPKYFSVTLLALPLTWFLLVVVKLTGAETNDAARWLSIGGVSFQPSEFAKVCLIGTTAFFLSKYKNTEKNIHYRLILISTAITCGIILLDNFSTAFLLFAVILMMMFVGQIPFKKLFVIIAGCSLAIGLFIGFLFIVPDKFFETHWSRPVTWKARIHRFVEKKDAKDDTYVITDENYQVTQANIAVARGGIFGKLPGNGRQRDFLPQAYSDFIFAITIEELGLVGGLFVLSLYVFLFIRTGIIAGRCDSLFPKLMAMGCALALVLQALTNMAVAVNLIPVTGQPLPLVSRGGTSTLVTCVFFGIILSVSRYENKRGIQREEEIDEELEKQRVEDEQKMTQEQMI